MDLMWSNSSTALMLGLHIIIQNVVVAPCKEAGRREQVPHYFQEQDLSTSFKI